MGRPSEVGELFSRWRAECCWKQIYQDSCGRTLYKQLLTLEIACSTSVRKPPQHISSPDHTHMSVNYTYLALYVLRTSKIRPNWIRVAEKAFL